MVLIHFKRGHSLPERYLALSQEVSSLLTKRAIEIVGDVNTPGVLQLPIHCPKVIGRLETCPGCQHPEFLCSDYKIQNGNNPLSSVFHPSRGLDGNYRHAGRIFPCSSPPRGQEISAVCVPGQGLPILSTVLRTIDSPSSFHPCPRPISKIATSHGDQNLHRGPKKDSSVTPRVGPADKPRQIPISPKLIDSKFGNEDQLSNFSGFSV